MTETQYHDSTVAEQETCRAAKRAAAALTVERFKAWARAEHQARGLDYAVIVDAVWDHLDEENGGRR